MTILTGINVTNGQTCRCSNASLFKINNDICMIVLFFVDVRLATKKVYVVPRLDPRKTT